MSRCRLRVSDYANKVVRILPKRLSQDRKYASATVGGFWRVNDSEQSDAKLMAHIGGKPSATQRMLIKCAATLALHIETLDRKLLQGRVDVRTRQPDLLCVEQQLETHTARAEAGKSPRTRWATGCSSIWLPEAPPDIASVRLSRPNRLGAPQNGGRQFLRAFR